MTDQPRILVLTGPNLNMLGVREPDIYGLSTLKDIEALCVKTAQTLGFSVECLQSNHEGELVTWIQESPTRFEGIVINAAAYTHTSVAILDALKLANLPVVEVHLTNIFAREHFRQHSFVSLAAIGVITGLGAKGYAYAIDFLAQKIKSKKEKA